MCCSDYPHSEGTGTPLDDYTGSASAAPDDEPGFFSDNAAFLLRAL